MENKDIKKKGGLTVSFVLLIASICGVIIGGIGLGILLVIETEPEEVTTVTTQTPITITAPDTTTGTTNIAINSRKCYVLFITIGQFLDFFAF